MPTATRSGLPVDGAALREAQKARALTHGEVAKLADVSHSHLSHMIAGRKGASAKVLRRIAHVLGLPMQALVAEPAADEVEDAA